jgi:hypothetical protein
MRAEKAKHEVHQLSRIVIFAFVKIGEIRVFPSE